MRLNVSFDARAHRFTSKSVVTVKEGGANVAEAAGSKHGARAFILSNTVGAKVDFLFTIPPTEDGGSPILRFEQAMEIAAGPGGKPTLKPAAAGRFGGAFHPRFFPAPTSVSSGKGTVFTIKIDLTFLDLTDRAGALSLLIAYDSQVPDFDGKPSHYDVELRLLEYTKGNPVTWAVLIPPQLKAAETRTDIPALLFYRPAGGAYRNTDNVRLNEFQRYIGDPPSHDPRAAKPPRTGIGLWPFYSNVLSPAGWTAFPFCGWDRQLAECNKQVVFIQPMPNGSAFGDVEGPTTLSLMEAVVRTLWADSKVGKQVKTGLTTGRMIVSAFSFGGDAFIKMFGQLSAAQRDRISELYLFDPNSFDVNQQRLTEWFSKGKKKLRLIGGNLHPQMMAFAQTLNSPDATIQPARLDYWQKDELYRSGILIEEMRNTAGTGPTAFSSRTGMFEVRTTRGDTAIVIEGRDATGKVVGSGEVLKCSNREAAAVTEIYRRIGVLERGLRRPPPKFTKPIPILPVKNVADLENNLEVMRDFVKWIRHQWVVCGGEDSKNLRDRGDSFKGYLQLCLERSGL